MNIDTNTIGFSTAKTFRTATTSRQLRLL